MDYPKTKEEWWRNFDECKAHLRNLVISYHPAALSPRKEMLISAPQAEAVCEVLRDAIWKERIDPVSDFDSADNERNGNCLVSILNQTWFGVPESMESRELPGFGVLCDLCSEAYVLEEGN